MIMYNGVMKDKKAYENLFKIYEYIVISKL
mgnify:CR=1 FL=1